MSDNLWICCDPSCLCHQLELDLIGSAIVKCLHDCASIITMPKPCSKRKVDGWSNSIKPQKIKADLWYKKFGVMQAIQLQGFSLKLDKNVVRQTLILRQQNKLRSERMAHALMDNHGHDFWFEIASQPLFPLQLMVLLVISLLLITGHPSLNLFSTLVINGWAYFQMGGLIFGREGSRNTPTPLFEQPLKFIAHGRIFESLQYFVPLCFLLQIITGMRWHTKESSYM